MQAELNTGLRKPGWPASPTATLFRTDFRRYWNDRTFHIVPRALAAIFVLQFVVALLLERALPIRLRVSWNLLYRVVGAIGLDPGWTTAMISVLGQLAPGVSFRTGGSPIWLIILLGLASVPLKMIAPAFAALSVAPDRENGRLEELLLAGFTPRQLLFAKGMAALAPFLLLWLVLELVGEGMHAYWITHYPVTAGRPGPNPGLLWWSFGIRVAYGVSGLCRYGIMVCISALCRRYRYALAGCYGVAFFWPLLIQTIFSLWPSASAMQVGARSMLPSLGDFIVTGVAVAVLVPKALKAIAETDNFPKPARRPMRIIDCGAEEAIEFRDTE